jgi:hypothetical protein
MSGATTADLGVAAAPRGADRVLLHYFDHEIRRRHWRISPGGRPVALGYFLRLGLIACGEFVAIPASSYFETPATRTTVNGLPGFIDAGWIRLFGRTRSLSGFRSHKQSQYADTASRHPVYFAGRALPGARRLEATWVVKPSSTTDAITGQWGAALEAEEPWMRRLLGEVRGIKDTAIGHS